MYVKPELQRYGTFREVTRDFQWCWMYPDFPLCGTTPSLQGDGGPEGEGDGTGSGEGDRS